MKRINKLLSILFVSLFSLASCDGVEKVISNSDGNATTTKTIKKTSDHIQEVIEDGMLGLSLSLNTINESKRTNIVSGVANVVSHKKYETIADLKTNQNLDDLRKSPADSSDCEIQYSLTNKDYTSSTNAGEYENVVLYSYQLKNNEETINNNNTNIVVNKFTQDDTNNYAKEVLSYVDNSYLKDLTGIDFDLQEAISMHEKVSKGNITSEEYLSYIDESYLNNALKNSLSDGMYAVLVDVVDNLNTISPISYIDYSRIKDFNNSSITGSLDYLKWKTALVEYFDGYLTTIPAEEENSEDITKSINSIKNFIETSFVDELSLTYTLHYNFKDIIDSISLSYYSKEIDEISSSLTMVEENSYNINISFEVSKRKIEI